MTEAVQDTAAADTATADAAAAEKATADAAAVAAASAAAQEPVIPETYTLTLPKGTLLSEAALERATAAAKALKVTQDADAQALVGLLDAEAKEVITIYEAARAPGGTLHAAMVKQVAEDALKHPALGNGDPVKFEQKQLQAGLVLNRFGGSGEGSLNATIKARGYLTTAELLFLNGVHAAMGEKSLVVPSSPTKPEEKPTLGKRMFGDLDKQLAAAGVIAAAPG